jgi:hypothetical protein
MVAVMQGIRILRRSHQDRARQPHRLARAVRRAGRPPKRAPGFNEHGDEILTGTLGLDAGAVLDLTRKGIVA